MHDLSSSMSDRVSFDESVRAWADECIRAADVPLLELDIEELALEHFKLERELIESIVDDVEEAEARYLEAFRQAYQSALNKEEA